MTLVKNFRNFAMATLAVCWRDNLIFIRYRGAFIAAFIWPLITSLSFIFLVQGLAGPSGEGAANFVRLSGTHEYLAFSVWGGIIFMFMNMCMWSGGLALNEDRLTGVFETHWVMPVSRLVFVLGKTLSSTLQQLVPLVVTVLVLQATGLLAIKASFGVLLVILLAAMPFLFGFLLAFAALTLRLREAAMIVLLVRTAFSVLCGIQFPLAVLPEIWQKVATIFPLTHAMNLVRATAIGGDSLHAHLSSLVFLLSTGVVFLLIGLATFFWVETGLQKRGLVSGY